MLPYQNDSLAIQSARFLALSATFALPNTPHTPDDARTHELARLLAYAPNTLPEALALSQKLLAERDFAAGTTTGVIFDLDSLSDHFGVERSRMLSACKLCGARAFQSDGKTVWANDGKASFTLTGPEIKRVSALASG